LKIHTYSQVFPQLRQYLWYSSININLL